jgi:hypothetical protein
MPSGSAAWTREPRNDYPDGLRPSAPGNDNSERIMRVVFEPHFMRLTIENKRLGLSLVDGLDQVV